MLFLNLLWASVVCLQCAVMLVVAIDGVSGVWH